MIMMKAYRFFLAGLFLIYAGMPARACSFAPGYTAARPSLEWSTPRGPRPPKPAARVVSLKRGFDDGNGGSCSDAGVLTIGVTPDEDTSGYLLKLVKGRFPDQVTFPDYYISPIRIKGGVGFRFVWLDWAPEVPTPKPIDLEISITQISNRGRLSRPTILHVISGGGSN